MSDLTDSESVWGLGDEGYNIQKGLVNFGHFGFDHFQKVIICHLIVLMSRNVSVPPNETFLQKAKRKFSAEPLVPIGLVLTITALV